jgi:4-alpha-glucanotransferase
VRVRSGFLSPPRNNRGHEPARERPSRVHTQSLASNFHGGACISPYTPKLLSDHNRECSLTSPYTQITSVSSRDAVLTLTSSPSATSSPIYRSIAGEPVPEGYTEMFPASPDPRRAGVIMHPTSLPGSYGIGDMGSEAYAFVDWLAEAKMQIWQVLPLVPPGRPIPGVREDYWSPYSGRDAHCGNTLIISLAELVKDGLLQSDELPHPYNTSGDVDFNKVAERNEPLIAKAATRLVEKPDDDALKVDFNAWRARPEIEVWLKEAALFDAICKTPELLGKDWWDWPEDLRTRDVEALEKKRKMSVASIDEFCATQFLFDKQWLAIKAYANSKGIALVGDMPIYVGGHSADVWANQNLFLLGSDCKPTAVAGVPPDAFSEDGQLWGNPLYDWPAHETEDYSWWAGRLGRALELHDEVRIDHFRAFAAYYSIPAGASTAKTGQWLVGPGEKFFKGIEVALGGAPIVAEDLGVITEDVVALREGINAPGMVVLQFAWGDDVRSPHLLHNHYENSFCYPGTHDNETTQGWYDNQDDSTKLRLANYAGINDAEGAAWGFIRLGMSSVSKACVFAMQDVLSLGNEARMNTPGVADGNWAWRVGPPGAFADASAEAKKLAKLADAYQRVATTGPQASSKDMASKVAEADAVPTPSMDPPAPELKKKFLGMF